MSKTKTKSVKTTEGTVEYEIVECSSCGNEIAREDAEKFVIIHSLKKERNWSRHTEFECYDHTEGWACKYCRDDPIGFPKKNEVEAFIDDYKDLLNTDYIEDALFKTLMISVVLVGVFLLVSMSIS